MERNFNADSRITTMHKDLNLTRNLANDLGVPLFVTSSVFELFQAGLAVNPEEDNWAIIELLESIVGVEVKKTDSRDNVAILVALYAVAWEGRPMRPTSTGPERRACTPQAITN